MSLNPDNEIKQHGGNLSYILSNFPAAPRPYIDLSTGINPYSYPIGLDNSLASRLSDIKEIAEALSSAAKYYGADEQNINMASGMQPLMFAIASLRFQRNGASRVAILSPTYSEYEKIWLSAGHEVVNIGNIADMYKADIAIICNPNNPDARISSPEFLVELAKAMAQKNGWLIVDESFADLTPELSIVTHIKEQGNLIAMRSCGKFFGIAGLRVSFAIAPQEISDWLRAVIGSWPIETQVCKALPSMFSDVEWIEKNRYKLMSESLKWREILAQYFKIIGYSSLFTLIETEAAYWHKKLAENGILVRMFDYNKNWLRFGLPAEVNLKRIENILNEIKKENK